MPTLDKMITDARMNLVRARNGRQRTGSDAREAAIVLREIKRQIEEIVTKAQGIELMKDPFPKPKSMTEFRDQYWMAHVQNNQLINADGLAFQGNLITQSKIVVQGEKRLGCRQSNFLHQISGHHRRNSDRPSGTERAGSRAAGGAGQIRDKVLEESKDIKERFFAAYAVGIDGELLLNGFKELLVRLSEPT